MASPLNSLAERKDERKGERDTTLFSLMLLTNKVFVAPLLACRANGSSLLCPAIRRPHSLMGRKRGSICLTKVGKTGRQSVGARAEGVRLPACVRAQSSRRSFVSFKKAAPIYADRTDLPPGRRLYRRLPQKLRRS